MAEVMNMPTESLGTGPHEVSVTEDATSPPPPPPPPEAAVQKRRDRDFRDRKDDRDRDRDRDLDNPYSRQRGGDYYDRKFSSPTRDHERDFERDFKRRRSPSPPYRDRRRSPFKRYRRDDGGLDRKGGFGPDERRFGYDNVAVYERGMGGRHGFSNNRSGRFMSRPMGYSELESGHGGYNSADIGTKQREGLMSYKQFIQELEDDILPAEAERRYQEYKSEYISTQKHAFFDSHKDEEWLRDKYHPTNLLKVIERRNARARQIMKDFLLDLQNGTLDIGPCAIAPYSHKLGQASDPYSDDEVDGSGKRRRHGRGAAKENDISVAPKAHPVSSEPRRMDADIEQSLALVQKLDFEKGIADNILSIRGDRSSGSIAPIVIVRGLTSVKGLEGIELLDTLITYLWRIHGLDYYGMIETIDAKDFRHVRIEGKGHDDSNKGGAAEWEQKLDSFWKERLNGHDPIEILTAKEKIDAVALEVLDPFVRKIRDEKYGWKYGCGAKGCTKLFHASEFVHKHLKLKHPELVMELTSKLRENLYFQNYMNDPLAPGGTPVMQKLPQMEKAGRRKASLEERLRDERGNEAVSSKGVDDGFGGQAPPPPSVLMPVPGAGPLGPFVPAPPEVAMLMMREPPYEGRMKWPPGGSTSSSRHYSSSDSRRIRSYQDLDAPDEQVTVIDYRSL